MSRYLTSAVQGFGHRAWVAALISTRHFYRQIEEHPSDRSR
jgi:hypothetical protein